MNELLNVKVVSVDERTVAVPLRIPERGKFSKT
jgi:hypothetical protein